MTAQTKFAEGYQAALEDIAAALDTDGEDGVRTWLANNLVGMHDRSGDDDYSERES